jgi:hypothetical protein
LNRLGLPRGRRSGDRRAGCRRRGILREDRCNVNQQNHAPNHPKLPWKNSSFHNISIYKKNVPQFADPSSTYERTIVVIRRSRRTTRKARAENRAYRWWLDDNPRANRQRAHWRSRVFFCRASTCTETHSSVSPIRNSS